MNVLLPILPIYFLKRVRHYGRICLAYLKIPFFRRKLERSTPILVYQMGKVGSSSVYSALKKMYPGVVLHTHVFSQDHANPLIRRLYNWVVVEKNPVRVISLTREPIIKNVSGFFHNYERYTGLKYRDDASLEDLREAFLENYVHNNVLTWFDDHILGVFGLDVYQEPFPEKGVKVYEHEQLTLLVMRSEIANSEKEKAIAELTGLREFVLHDKNVGAKKYYAKVYRKFVQTVKLPSDYCNRMIDSKYYPHFYSADAIHAERKRWEQVDE